MLIPFGIPRVLGVVLLVFLPIDVYLFLNSWFGVFGAPPGFLIVFLVICIPLLGIYWVYVTIFRFLDWGPLYLMVFWLAQNLTIIAYMFNASKTIGGGGPDGTDAVLVLLYGPSLLAVFFLIKLFPSLSGYILDLYPKSMQKIDLVADVLLSCLTFSVLGLIQALFLMAIGWLISRRQVGHI